MRVNGGGLKEAHTSTKNFIGFSVMRTLSLLVSFKCYFWEGKTLRIKSISQNFLNGNIAGTCSSGGKMGKREKLSVQAFIGGF